MSEAIHIVCPHCLATNRMPVERIGDGAHCGKCKKPLFTGQPVELNNESFQHHLQGNDIPFVVDFWAPWCGPCRGMAPVFTQAASELEPKFRFAKLNTDQAQPIAGQYAIRSIPTVIVFARGRELARRSGAMDLGSLKSWLLTQTR